MADVSLVCVREDAWKADLLADALERYGFAVCRSATVFEDFQGYAAVIVLLSPGAARSELVMGTASRAIDWGKLIPVFVNLCALPDCLSGVALHDLSMWDGQGEDAVVKAIAYHAQRLSGQPGRPVLGAPSQRQVAPRLALDTYAAPQAYIEPPRAAPNYGFGQDYAPVHQEPAYEEPVWGRERAPYTPPTPYFVAAAHNEMDYAPPAHAGYHRPVDSYVAASVANDAAQRRAYFMERAAFMDAPRAPNDYAHEPPEETPPPPRQRRPLSGLFTVFVSALALIGTAWVEEARTREIEILRATPAEATAVLTTPADIDLTSLPRERLVPRR